MNAAGVAPATFQLAPPPPPPHMFQPFPPPAPRAAVPFVSTPAARLPPPHTYRVTGRRAMAPRPAPGLQIRPVTAANYEAELDFIASLLSRYPYVAIDTEYPGTVHGPPPGKHERDLSPPERYALLKANADELPVVQLGVTLCDEFGNLPTTAVVSGDGRGRPAEIAWEVTFSDFDPRRHAHAPESVAFLRSRGVDFDAAREIGVGAAAFAAKLAAVLSAADGELVAWAAFGGARDFAYLVKMLAGGGPLPETWHEFAAVAGELLGARVFDAKYMAEHCERPELCGGLRRVAESLHVQRQDFPAACLAGRKSYVACRVFTAMRRRVLYRDSGACHQGLIDGLHN